MAFKKIIYQFTLSYESLCWIEPLLLEIGTDVTLEFDALIKRVGLIKLPD